MGAREWLTMLDRWRQKREILADEPVNRWGDRPSDIDARQRAMLRDWRDPKEGRREAA